MYRYNKKKRILAKRYSKVKLAIGIFNGIFVPMIFLIMLLISGLNTNIVNIVYRFGIFSIPAYAFIFMTLLTVVQFPVRFYSSFVYEHRYRLSNHTLRGWFTDYFKGLFLGYLFFIPIITGFFIIAGTYYWWIYATAAYFLLVVFMSYIFPITIMPFFYKIDPYKNLRHRKELLAMTKRLGLTEIKNVVVHVGKGDL